MDINLYNISEQNITESIFPNVWVLVAHLLATIILIILIIFFAWKPTKEFLKKRKEAIQKEIDETNKNKRESEKELLNSKKIRLDSEEYATNLCNNAKNDALVIKQKIEDEANINAKIILEKANLEIKSQEKKMKSDLESQISDVAISVAEELIKTKINKSKNAKLVDDIIEDIKKSR